MWFNSMQLIIILMSNLPLIQWCKLKNAAKLLITIHVTFIVDITNDIMTASFDAEDIHKMILDIVVAAAEVDLRISQMNLIRWLKCVQIYSRHFHRQKCGSTKFHLLTKATLLIALQNIKSHLCFCHDKCEHWLRNSLAKLLKCTNINAVNILTKWQT